VIRHLVMVGVYGDCPFAAGRTSEWVGALCKGGASSPAGEKMATRLVRPAPGAGRGGGGAIAVSGGGEAAARAGFCEWRGRHSGHV
jgi:hypothetical protein